MEIEKLPSGSYRLRQRVNGQRYSVTVDHKPSQKEAIELLAEVMKDVVVDKASFRSAANKYISLKENILSPRTVREYKLYIDRLPEWFTSMNVSSMSADTVQQCVNELALGYSPKTVRSLHGFVSAVLRRARPHLTLNTTLPKLQKKSPYIPKKEDLKAILEVAEGTQYYIPIRLGCYGLRRGEICALELSDLTDDNVLHITKDLVQTSKGDWVKKPPKTPGSVRDVLIDKELADRIRTQGYIFNGFPGTISNFLRRTQIKLGMERFSLHKLRHLFASVLLDKGYDMKTIQELGGWQGSETITNIYLHSLKLKDAEKRKQITADISSFIE